MPEIKEHLKDWLWKYPLMDCPEGCKTKIVNQSVCDSLVECKHGFWQLPCGLQMTQTEYLEDRISRIEQFLGI